MACRIGLKLESLAIAQGIGEQENGRQVVGHVIAVEEDIDRITLIGCMGLEFAGRDKLVANPKRQKERTVGVSRMEPDAQVVGRLGTRLDPGPESARVGITAEGDLD